MNGLSDYYEVLLILHELHQKIPWNKPSRQLTLTKDNPDTKIALRMIKNGNYTELNKFSVEVLLDVLKRSCVQMRRPIFSSSGLLHRRWLDIGFYVRRVRNVHPDIKPDLILHVGRVVYSHYKNYDLLVLQNLVGVLRLLASKPESELGVNLDRKLLMQISTFIAPGVCFERPTLREYLCKKFCGKRRSEYTAAHAIHFLVAEAHEIFAADNGAVSANIPYDLLNAWPSFFKIDEDKINKPDY